MCTHAKDPLFWIVIVAGVITLAGAGMGIFEYADMEDKNAGRVPIWFHILGAFVPLFSFLGRLRRSQLLLSAATMLYVFSITAMGTLMRYYVLLKTESGDEIFFKVGASLEIAGTTLAMVPVFAGLKFIHASFIGSLFIGIFWTVAGIIFSVLASKQLVLREVAWALFCFLFAIWTVLTSFKRTATFMVALSATELLLLQHWVSGFNGLVTTSLTNAAYAFAITASILQLFWFALEFVIKPIPDTIKTPKRRDEGLN